MYFQALRVQKATNNKRSIIDRLFFFWQPFPLTKEQFLEGVARKCKKHYFDDGQVLPHRHESADQPAKVCMCSWAFWYIEDW